MESEKPKENKKEILRENEALKLIENFDTQSFSVENSIFNQE